MSEATQVTNFIVVVNGRGVLQTCIAKGTLDDVTRLADLVLLSGFEVHIYSLRLATPNGRPSYLPEGINPLACEFACWDASDEIHDLTNSIVMHMDEHTEAAAARYLQQAIDQLTEELGKLQRSSEHIATSEPTFGGAEGTTTGK
jgi:hypothetical protein